MHDMSAHAVRLMEPRPASFGSTSSVLDHKVIGKQYYALALVAALIGMVLSWLMRIHLGWAQFRHSRAAAALEEWRAGRRDDAGVLPAIDDHARHHHGLLRAHHGAVCGIRQLLFAHSGGRRGYAVPALQHDVVLGHVRRVLVLVASFFVPMGPPSAAGRSTLH